MLAQVLEGIILEVSLYWFTYYKLRDKLSEVNGRNEVNEKTSGATYSDTNDSKKG